MHIFQLRSVAHNFREDVDEDMILCGSNLFFTLEKAKEYAQKELEEYTTLALLEPIILEWSQTYETTWQAVAPAAKTTYSILETEISAAPIETIDVHLKAIEDAGNDVEGQEENDKLYDHLNKTFNTPEWFMEHFFQNRAWEATDAIRWAVGCVTAVLDCKGRYDT